MCCCGKPTVNGEPHAYSWDGKSFITYQPNPPELADGDTLSYDEPGRCGGVDSHSHHFRLVKAKYGGFVLLVRHGGGTVRIPLGYRSYIPGVLAELDSNGRYWLMLGVYHVHEKAVRNTEEQTNAIWRKAAVDKRIRTKKQRGRDAVKVWVELLAVSP